MDKHTPTPWKRDDYGQVLGADNETMALTKFALSSGPRNPIAENNGDLVFACVNAFHDPAGRKIATEDIGEGLFWRMYDALNLWSVSDEEINEAASQTARQIAREKRDALLSSIKVQEPRE